MKMSIYQVFTRLFGNDNDTNKYGGTIQENGVGKMEAFTRPILEEIKSLGITHIWYTGVIEHATTTHYSGIRHDSDEIVKGRAGSPYAIKDYYDIDPDIAVDVDKRMEEFEELIERTHSVGLRAIIDFVPNHLAREYEAGLFEDKNFYILDGDFVVPEGIAPYGALFKMKREDIQYRESPARATGNDCFSPSPSINDWYETVKLNYGINYNDGSHNFDPIPDTWFKMRDILLYWTNKHVDGFRCDMVEMVPVEFWHWVIPQIKDVDPYITFIAEVYNPNEYRDYILNGHFDYLYNKVGLYDTLRDIVYCQRSTKAITNCWQQTEGINDNMLQFLENHDEQRIASHLFAENPFKAIPAMMVSATINRGAIMTYFGQEVGEPAKGASGFSGDDGRTSIFDYCSVPELNKWKHGKLSTVQKELRRHYSQILNFAISSEAIAKGEFYDLMWLNMDNPNIDKLYIYARHTASQKLLIVINFGSIPLKTPIVISEHARQTIGINQAKELREIFGKSVYDIGTDIDISGYSYKVFEII